MSKSVWAVVEDNFPDGVRIIEMFATQEEADEMVRLITESQEDEFTDDNLVQIPYTGDTYYTEEHVLATESPAELMRQRTAEQLKQVNKLRELYASPEYIERQRKFEEKYG